MIQAGSISKPSLRFTRRIGVSTPPPPAFNSAQPILLAIWAVRALSAVAIPRFRESLVIGRPDPDGGALKLLPYGAYYETKRRRLSIETGTMASESQALLAKYVRRTVLRRHLAEEAV